MARDPLIQESERACRHVWRPYADEIRIWRVCDKCGGEEHVVTHEQHLMDTLAHIFREGYR